jgi:DeoR/GlpR family transcriptional regulator of sugar metabolism
MAELLPDVRRRLIIQHIERLGMVRVADLASEMSVAEETVRRDLKVLDERGVLVRTHGGAVSLKPLEESAPRSTDLPFELRRKAMLPQKQAIAQEALRRTQGVATIALDGSTTAWELATLLHDPALTVVTNSLMITNFLGSRPSSQPAPQVISVGGTLDRKLQIFTGMIAMDGLRHIDVDIFFCSCGGIDPTRGFSDPSETAALFKRQLIRQASQTVILADSTKFRSRAPVFFADLEDVQELITDADAPTDALNIGRLVCTRVAVK